MSDAELRVVAETLASRFTEIFDGADHYLGPVGLSLLRATLEKVSLTSERGVEDLTTLPVLADAAGRHEESLAAAEVLLGVPWTGDHDRYDSIRQVVAGAARRCELLGRDPEPFRSAVLPPEQGQVTSELRSRASGALWKKLQETRNQTTAGRHGVTVAAMGIKERYLAWALGGSLLFSRRKIDQRIEQATGRLRELRAIR